MKDTNARDDSYSTTEKTSNQNDQPIRNVLHEVKAGLREKNVEKATNWFFYPNFMSPV